MINKEDELLNALLTISLAYSDGIVSSDVLRKACSLYKEKVGFVEDEEYDLIVTKSCCDFLNGVDLTIQIEKAVLPGQTKIVDGVMYVYSATKQGSKTKYGWHVIKKPKGKFNQPSMTSKTTAMLEDDVNTLFPEDVNSLSKVNVKIGGSTGAELFEDSFGNRYIMKKGSNPNDNNEHISKEFISNQLYSAMNVTVPYYEMYGENGDLVLLSKFIPGCHKPDYNAVADNKRLADYFMYDVLLANWDAYKNDNCLIDSNGHVYHVDNGGCLDQRAQGNSGRKNFDANVLETFEGMKRNNQGVFNCLTQKDIEEQILTIRKYKNNIVGYLEEIGETKLANVMSQRIDNLDDVIQEVAKSKKNTQILNGNTKRNLKSAKDMYRKLSDKELEGVWEDMDKQFGNGGKMNGNEKVTFTKNHGWELLNKICELRGFNARPQVVTEKEYWDLVGKDASKQLFRGIHRDDSNRLSLKQMASNLMYDDECWWGKYGAYGEGLYAHRNADKRGNVSQFTKESNYKDSPAYKHAIEYATDNHHYDDGVIVKGVLAPDAKIVQFTQIKNELDNLIANEKNADDIFILQDYIDTLRKDYDSITEEINNLGKNVRDEVFKKMHYDETSFADMNDDIINTDWDATDSKGNPAFPSYSDFVETRMVKWVKAQGGNAIKEQGQVRFTLPNTKKECVITKYNYDGPDALKRKNVMTSSWNYAACKFQDWITTEHVNKVFDAVKIAEEDSSQKMQDLFNKRNQINNEISAKQLEINKLNTVNANDGVIEAIAANKNSYLHDEVKGLLAAVKGYDAIECQPSAGSNSFYIILNRSKMIVSNEIDVL